MSLAAITAVFDHWLCRLRAGAVGALAQRLKPFAPPALAGWFALQSWLRMSRFLSDRVPWGLDARIYYRGAVAWLGGHDPWSSRVTFDGHVFTYAGTPATTVAFAPAALLPEDVFVIAWLCLTTVAALWTLRRLELPVWWILFPPTVEALFSGNPQLVILALLLMRGPLPGAAAVVLKGYPIIPLIGRRRWRATALGVGLTALTAALAPALWLTYLHKFGAISARLAHESQNGWSAFAYPSLLVPVVLALVALARRDRAAAGWLTVPALWPATEFHYSTFALPLRSPTLAAMLSVSTMQWPPVAITLYALARIISARRLRVASASGHRPETEPTRRRALRTRTAIGSVSDRDDNESPE